MTDRPILFSGSMVRAILDGAKTQTRRLVKPDDVHECGWASGPWRMSDGSLAKGEDGAWSFGKRGVKSDPSNFYVYHRAKPLAQPGDTLWVKETWRISRDFDHLAPCDVPSHDSRPTIHYLADTHLENDPACPRGKTRVSIHMPRWASRLTLRVTDVRVERLGDISEADARAEGLRLHAAGWTDGVSGYDTPSARDAFPELWEHVHGDGAWERDRKRWVWVYGFEVVR